MGNPRKELNTCLQALQHISRLHFYIRGLFLLETPFFFFIACFNGPASKVWQNRFFLFLLLLYRQKENDAVVFRCISKYL